MKARPANPRSLPIVAALRSGPFVALVGAFVLLGVAALGRVWHEHRNALLRREIFILDRDLKELERQIQALQGQVADELSPRTIEGRIRELGLGLGPPAEDQLLRVEEPVWEGLGPQRTGVASGESVLGKDAGRRAGPARGPEEVTMR